MSGSTYPDEETPLNGEKPEQGPGSEMQNSVRSENPPKQHPRLERSPQRQSKINQSISESIYIVKKKYARAKEVSASLQKGFSLGFHSFIDSTSGLHFAFTCLVLYYASAVVAFSHFFENWSYIDSMYFATITFLTIGYGDLSPSTDGGRLFTVFFALVGIFILGFFLGIIGERLVDMETKAYNKMREKARNKVKSMFGMKINEEAEKHEPKTVFGLIFHVVRLELPLIALIFVCGIFYGTVMEQWTVIESIYFSTITFSTVGFGDYAPEGPCVRALCIFVLPLMVAIFCELIGRIASAYLQHKLHLAEDEFLNRQFTRTDLELMDMDKNGNVCYGEFLHYMLLAMQKVDEEDLLHIKEVFDKLDITKEGNLSKKDLCGSVGIVRQKECRHLMDGVV
mmetsp:Transcript_17461/g.25806  ORF Transcript_17461/g.25806 Transcript_17461/m.25806 type:complete len:397 (-) Transcript_17461:37-1227(-)|eukprot:CAMPEP_0194215274 /NCGR_PEP_ID=MMETSP0156-20130528/16972_1 /TAXON_ID=33649 /ORGANISM="Thalassionema nitzschioides, Strain L26-B" /LENGTH=396 /DNA_ID=CAMNT_0038943753 /DNA_START=92 /DNA_END=1282 /DNA_ORIENTATION=+